MIDFGGQLNAPAILGSMQGKWGGDISQEQSLDWLTAALKACDEFKVASRKDAAQLAVAKDAVYKAGFYDGVFLVGDYAGKAVRDVKTAIRDDTARWLLGVSRWRPSRVTGAPC